MDSLVLYKVVIAGLINIRTSSRLKTYERGYVNDRDIVYHEAYGSLLQGKKCIVALIDQEVNDPKHDSPELIA